MFLALVLLFFVIMLVVLFARALSEQTTQRIPDGYPNAPQMPQQMPPQSTYTDPYSDTGYYQSGEYAQQGSGTPPPKEANAFERGYEQGYAGYTSRSDPGTMPRADEAAAAYEAERVRSTRPGNYDTDYYQQGASNREHANPGSVQYNQPQSQYEVPMQQSQPPYQQPYSPYSQQQQSYGPGYPPPQQPQYGPQGQPYQPPYGPQGPYPQQPFPQQRSGMNPWIAGGLGAIMGYGLGNLFSSHDYGAVPMDHGDAGGFGGGDFGGGDFGGEGDFGDSGGGDF
ncbi:hypothetical protein [Ktedonospora formicarum]|uniref:Uncharacterized protein n=1 Tax=Ktedonospora formicarum TaxID=2778364 RepID=A0A8J3I2F5_9CHLR|nr:hypothetical protein [Ktedonospora formicarum]GHO46366.1 hypothetical protein KSX_45290 [Ktedonospora formicarum]